MLASLIGVALAIIPVPADTQSYAVLNHGRPGGEMLVIRSGDTVVVKYHHYDRQRGPRSETRYVLKDGAPTMGETWNLPLYGPEPTPRPAPFDRFELMADSVSWKAGDSVRRAARVPGSYYRLRSFTAYDQALLARYLLRRPDRTAPLISSGTARLEIVADTTLRTHGGRQRVRLLMIQGPRGEPSGAWLDEKDELIAGESGWFVTIRRGSEEIIPALRAMEFRYRNARGAALAKRLAPPASSSIAIVNGDLFDSERGVIRPRSTVVVRGDRIVAAGPADSIQVPAGARIIDAVGKTVMPGMVDMHTHAFLLSQSIAGPVHLSLGITTIRDLAADFDVATELRDRSALGEILAPRVVLAGFLEGPGHWAGPTAAIVSTEAEARSWIARYDSAGYKQVKLYNLVQQDLVPIIVAEAHRRGMRVSGHVPRGLSTQAAVRLGFDEINHAAFLFSTFFPDSLYIPEMRAYSAVSQIVAPNVDVDGPEVSAMLELFKQKGTVIDGTWNLWMSAGGPASTAVAIPGAPNQTAAQKSDANYLRMLKRVYDAGIPLVAGTDGSSYNAELELYERAGIPPAEVLRIATLVPQRVMGTERDYGSLAVGKVADLIIVDGKPAERVSDLRKVEQVMRAGRIYEVKALKSAVP